MNSPMVSICLPNLNTFAYLEERWQTIVGQTYENWELIVVDSYSDDGSWEFFQDLARKDPRVLIRQGPRGLYASWNRCIESARGDYLYIATSDDTMAPDCLERLVAALEQHTDCDLAHCRLVLLDKDGATITPEWREASVFSVGASDLINRRHVRRAPYDGLLHLTGQMVYQSITELLIRRSLFAKIGAFSEKWGSVADLNWNMKAGLVSNTVHVPDTWASWRLYETQATASVKFTSSDHRRKVGEMIREAISSCEGYLAPKIVEDLNAHWIPWSNEMREYYAGLRERPGFVQRKLFQASHAGDKAVRAELIERMGGSPRWPERAPDEIRCWLESLGAGPALIFES